MTPNVKKAEIWEITTNLNPKYVWKMYFTCFPLDSRPGDSVCTVYTVCMRLLDDLGDLAKMVLV